MAQDALTPSDRWPGAWIDAGAVVADSARVAPGAWIGPGVTVEAEAVIAPHAIVGLPLPQGGEGPVLVGPRCWIGPGACIGTDVLLGAGCRVGHDTTVGPGCRLGREVAIGPRCTLMGHARIDEFAVLVSEVHVCEAAVLEHHCQLMPGVILANDSYPPTRVDLRPPVVGPCAVVGAKAVIWPGVRLGYHALVATLSEVKEDVDDYVLARGQPARPVCDVRMIRTRVDGRWVYPYPWMRHLIEGEDIHQPVAESFERNREIMRRFGRQEG